jgi:hypothetical protein
MSLIISRNGDIVSKSYSYREATLLVVLKIAVNPQSLAMYNLGHQRVADCVNPVCTIWTRNGTELAKRA